MSDSKIDTSSDSMVPGYIVFSKGDKIQFVNGTALGIHVEIVPVDSTRLDDSPESSEPGNLPDYITYNVARFSLTEEKGGKRYVSCKVLGEGIIGGPVNSYLSLMEAPNFAQKIAQDIALYFEEETRQCRLDIEGLKEGMAKNSKDAAVDIKDIKRQWWLNEKTQIGMDPSYQIQPFDPIAYVTKNADECLEVAEVLKESRRYIVLEKRHIERVPDEIMRDNGNYEFPVHIVFQDDAVPLESDVENNPELFGKMLTGIHVFCNKPNLSREDLYDQSHSVFDIENPTDARFYVIDYQKNPDMKGSVAEGLKDGSYFEESPRLIFKTDARDLQEIIMDEDDPVECFREILLEQISLYKRILTDRIESLTLCAETASKKGRVLSFQKRKEQKEPRKVALATSNTKITVLDEFKGAKGVTNAPTDISDLSLEQARSFVDLCASWENRLPKATPTVLLKRDVYAFD